MKKRTRRFIAAFAGMVLSVFLLAGGALADGTAAATVHVNSHLNIRQSNNTSSSIIGKLNNGENVTVLGNTGGWYHITGGGVTGWVSGQYLTLSATVNVTMLNVRQVSSSEAAIIDRIYSGLLVTITDSSSNGWYKISYYDGTGWVNGSYLTLGNAYLSGSAKANVVDSAVQSVIGAPYLFGGTTITGFDCSGLALYAFKKIGISLPHSASQQATLGTEVSRDALQPGDLLFFDTDGGHDTITHEGIYIGAGNFINAETGTVERVNEGSLNNSYWSAAFMTARRMIS